MTTHRSTHVSDADDADLHVLAACSNGQAEEATLEEDHIARRRTCRQLRELGQRPLALLRRLRSIGLAQGAPNAVRVQIGAIDGRPGLLSPGLVERSRVDAVEAELVDEGQDHGLGEGIVAGDGESDPILRSFRPAPLRQEVRSDVVEHLHHGSPEHAGNPTRLGARFFDGRDAAVAKRGVVVARVDDDDVARHAAEESLGKSGTFFVLRATTTRSTFLAASVTVTACAPVSFARSARVGLDGPEVTVWPNPVIGGVNDVIAGAADPGPREFAMDTVCLRRVSLRVSVLPTSPVPMMPIFMSWFLSFPFR